MLGMQTVFSIKPSEQLPIPKKVITEGDCPVWSWVDDERKSTIENKCSMNEKLVKENEMLREQIKQLEKQLHLE